MCVRRPSCKFRTPGRGAADHCLDAAVTSCVRGDMPDDLLDHPMTRSGPAQVEAWRQIQPSGTKPLEGVEDLVVAVPLQRIPARAAVHGGHDILDAAMFGQDENPNAGRAAS